MSVTEGVGFMAVCIGNFFTSQGIEENQPETKIKSVIEHFCEVISKSMDIPGLLFEEDELIKSSMNTDYFERRLEQMLNNGPLTWGKIFIVLGMYAQMLDYLNRTSDDTFPYVMKLERLCEEYNLNQWVKQQPRQWYSFLDFYKNPTV